MNIQKQPSRGVPKKRCSENMQQSYRRTPMLKCDFNKDGTSLGGCFWIFSCKKSKDAMEKWNT